MEFSRREYWSGLPFPSRGDFPDPGIEPTSPARAGAFFTNEPAWRPTTPSRLHVYGRVIIFATKHYFFDGIFSSKLDNPTSHTFLGPLEFLGCIRVQECLSGFAHLALIFTVSENSVPRILWCLWVSGSQGPSRGFGFPCLCYPFILCSNRRRQSVESAFYLYNLELRAPQSSVIRVSNWDSEQPQASSINAYLALFKTAHPRTSLVVQQLGVDLPMRGMWVRSLLGELWSYMLWGK